MTSYKSKQTKLSAGKLPPESRLGLVGKDILVLSPTPTFPLDQGNRKRIHAYCQELKKRGARIHFLFYPFEWWFTHIPHDHIDQMRAQWDTFHLLPVAKPLQAPAAGADHHIDEWWDWSAIEPYLNWLFERGRYDAFIVNYPYLSKAFDFTPSETVKILDMHDKFTGRRQLLESMGIAKEFFYTTPDQEAAALNRADLVWAIKDEEAEFFRTITKTSVITMPHVEPEISVTRKSNTDDVDYLVLGMVGARNNINFRNAEIFFNEVMPILIRNLAPVKIRFGGGMCSDLENYDSIPQGVELFGRFEQPEDFYQAIDVALVPLTFSTGLKIKAVEAFATGMPVVAHIHAVEGIPVEGPYHQCKSSEEIAERIMELAYEPERLAEVKQHTIDTYQRIKHQFDDSMRKTISRIHKRARIALCLGQEFLDPKSPYRAMAIETIHYLKHAGEIILYFDCPTPTTGEALQEAFYSLSKQCKIVLSRRAAQEIGETIQRGIGSSLGAFYAVMDIRELAEAERLLFLYMLEIPRECTEELADFSNIAHAFIRLDVTTFGGSRSRLEILNAYNLFPSATIITCGDVTSDPICDLDPDLDLIQVPYWRDFSWNDIQEKELTDSVYILTVNPDDEYVQHLIKLCELVLPDWQKPKMVTPECKKNYEAGNSNDRTLVSQIEWMKSFSNLTLAPRIVIDASTQNPEFSILHETLLRKRVPVINGRPKTSITQEFMHTGNRDVFNAETVSTLVSSLIKINEYNYSYGAEVSYWSSFSSDAGWCKLWNIVSRNSHLA